MMIVLPPYLRNLFLRGELASLGKDINFLLVELGTGGSTLVWPVSRARTLVASSNGGVQCLTNYLWSKKDDKVQPSSLVWWPPTMGCYQQGHKRWIMSSISSTRLRIVKNSTARTTEPFRLICCCARGVLPSRMPIRSFFGWEFEWDHNSPVLGWFFAVGFLTILLRQIAQQRKRKS